MGNPELMSIRLAEFADRPWEASSDSDPVDRGLSEGHDDGERRAAARQYVTIQICDAPIERMKPILEYLALSTKGKWLSRAVRVRLEKLEDVMAFKPVAGGVKRLGDTADVGALIAELKHNGYRPIESTARALGMIGDPKAIEPLLDVLLEDATSPSVGRGVSTDILWRARAATDALHKMGIRAPMELLVPLFSGHVNYIDSLRRETRKSGSNVPLFSDYINNIDSLDGLIGALRNEEWCVRELAAEVLGMIGDPKAMEPLMAALAEYRALPIKEREASIEFNASKAAREIIHALGSMGNSVPIDRLIAIFEEEISLMCARASDPSFFEKFYRLRQLDEFPTSLAELLGKVLDARTIEPLKRAVVLEYADSSLLGYEAGLALARLGEFRMRSYFD